MWATLAGTSLARATAAARRTLVARRWIASAAHHVEQPYRSPLTDDFNLATQLERFSAEIDAFDGRRPSSSASSSAAARDPYPDEDDSEETMNFTPHQKLQRRRNALPPSRAIFMGNLPFKVSEHEMMDMLEEMGIRGMMKVHLKTEPSGRGQGYGWVLFDTLVDSIAAFETIKQQGLRFRLRGRTLRAQYADNDSLPIVAPPSNRLFLGRFRGTPDDFYNIFDKYKNGIYWIDIKPYGKARPESDPSDTERLHYGVIAFNSIRQATKCLKDLNGQEVLPGVWLHLGYAERRRGDTWGHKEPSTWRERRRLGPERYVPLKDSARKETGGYAEVESESDEDWKQKRFESAGKLRPEQLLYRDRTLLDT